MELGTSLKDNAAGNAVGTITVSYTSSDKKIVTVDKKGKITAKGKGKAYIYINVKLYSGKSKIIKVSVYVQ